MKTIIIHPQVWNQVLKMYRYCYDTDRKLKTLFGLLNLDSNISDVNQYNLDDFFFDLTFKDAIKIFRDVLEIDDFWLSDYDQRNLNNNSTVVMNSLYEPIWVKKPVSYVPPIEKSWGLELVKLLADKNGIIYDRKSRSFTFKGVPDIRILPYTGIRFASIIEKEFNDHFFDSLVREINGTFASGFYTSTVILIRKLIENLLIDLLRTKFPLNNAENLELYYDKEHGRFRFFSELINRLISKKDQFTGIVKTVDRLVTKINEFKEHADSNTHSLTMLSSADDVTKYDVKEIIELILYLKNYP